jgi:hypothetical protein
MPGNRELMWLFLHGWSWYMLRFWRLFLVCLFFLPLVYHTYHVQVVHCPLLRVFWRSKKNVLGSRVCSTWCLGGHFDTIGTLTFEIWPIDHFARCHFWQNRDDRALEGQQSLRATAHIYWINYTSGWLYITNIATVGLLGRYCTGWQDKREDIS